MRAYAMTATANKLEADAMKLRLEHPADVFNPGKGCKAPPYVLPDPNGGFITLLEFGEPDCDPGCSTPKPSCGGCGCGGSTCGNSKCSDPKCVPSAPATTGTLRRYEEIAYSGFDKDNKTLILTERSVSGLVDQEWPAGTLIMQSGAAPYITMLEKLGCIMAIPKAKDCLQVKEGQFVGDPTCECWRQAKKDTVVTLDDDGILDYPAAGAAENDNWSQCYSLQQMLINALIEVPKLIEQLNEIQTLIDNGVYKNCAGKDLAKGSKVVACAEMGAGLKLENGKWVVDFSDVSSAPPVDNCTLKIVDGKLVAQPQYKSIKPQTGYVSVFRNETPVALDADFDEGTINIADYCGSDCRFNALRVNLRQSNRIDGIDGVSPAGAEVNGGFKIYVDGAEFDYRGFNLLVTDSDKGEQDREHSDEVITVPVGADGTISFAHIIKKWPAGTFAHLEHVGSVRVYGCEYVDWGN